MAQARLTESLLPLVQEDTIENLWTAWQNALGAVRVYVKVTTQCNVELDEGVTRADPKDQRKWKKCGQSKSFDKHEFPTAVATCARSDERQAWAQQEYRNAVHGRNEASPAGSEEAVYDQDRMVRFLGCGARRAAEPNMFFGTRTMCHTAEENYNW